MSGLRMSLNCVEATQQGIPNDRHACSGCQGCPCHHTPAPPDFRAQVAAAREARDTEGGAA